MDNDPDINFYNDIQRLYADNSPYLYEDHLSTSLSKLANQPNFGLFHINIRSLAAHKDELAALLKMLNYQFPVVGMTETWLTDITSSLYNIDGYVGEFNNRCIGEKGGGVGTFVKSHIPYCRREEFCVSDAFTETIFIEFDKDSLGTDKSVIVGVIYRPPNTDPRQFVLNLSDILDSIGKERKPSYFMGDFNLDLLKCDEHAPTMEYLNILYANSYLPMITRPTRVTQKPATLIDNIFTNNVSSTDHYLNGILLNDITDHFSVYHITNKTVQSKETICIHRRKMNDSCKQEFLNNLNTCDWNHAMDTDNAQEAYTKFSQTYQSIYDRCFPKYVVKKRYDNKIPWLSDALRKSINHKNKLYKKAKKYRTAKTEIEYRKYKAKLKSILKSAEKKHFQEIFLKYKGNLHRTWSVIKQLINRNKEMKVNNNFFHNGKTITNGNQIVNLFNDFFVNIGPTLANKIQRLTFLQAITWKMHV